MRGLITESGSIDDGTAKTLERLIEMTKPTGAKRPVKENKACLIELLTAQAVEDYKVYRETLHKVVDGGEFETGFEQLQQAMVRIGKTVKDVKTDLDLVSQFEAAKSIEGEYLNAGNEVTKARQGLNDLQAEFGPHINGDKSFSDAIVKDKNGKDVVQDNGKPLTIKDREWKRYEQTRAQLEWKVDTFGQKLSTLNAKRGCGGYNQRMGLDIHCAK